MDLLEAFVKEACQPTKSWPRKVEDYPSGVNLLAGTTSEKIAVAQAALQQLEKIIPLSEAEKHEWLMSSKGDMANALTLILQAILPQKLPISSDDIASMLKFVIHTYRPDDDYADDFFHWLPLTEIIQSMEWYFRDIQPTLEEHDLLQQLLPMLEKKSTHIRNNSNLAERVGKLPGIIREYQPEPGLAWADRVISDLEAMTPEARLAWGKILAHTASAESAKPSAKWLAEAARRREAIGASDVTQYIAVWLNLTAPPPAFEETMPHRPRYLRRDVSERNIVLLKGLAWYASLCPTPEMARAVGHLTSAAFTSVVGYGTWATKAGNAGIWALGQMPGAVGVGPLARLRTRLRDRGALKLIAAAIETAAKSAGMTVDALEDLAVPTGGLDADGTRREAFGEEGSATLTLDAKTGQTRLEWFGADGKSRKAVPAGVKREFAAEVKALKAAEAEVAQAVSAQAARLDGFLAAERVWPLLVWRERYAGHPILGNLARRLIWTVGGVSALPGAAAFEGAADDAEVTLWHPISAKPEEVMRWRDALEGQGIVQPFKQAHREVYLLTDAERTTRTYSNRFAAHILKQHQFNSLCVLRGWKNALRLMVDDEYPPATLPLPKHGLRAEFWVEGIGDNYGTDTNETGTYLRLATDQVRFYRADAEANYAHASGGGYGPGYRGTAPEPVPLDQIPPLTLSEVMRDVDLFVGVSSVGNDPTWADGGPEGRYRDYWRDYAFGDLSETAKTRAEVLTKLLPRLKIAGRCRLDGKFLIVRGDLRTYKIHLGSGNILMEPNDQYLCIVPGRTEDTQSSDLFLPFEGDRMLAIVLSKAFLLAEDTAIKDATIVRQINRAG